MRGGKAGCPPEPLSLDRVAMAQYQDRAAVVGPGRCCPEVLHITWEVLILDDKGHEMGWGEDYKPYGPCSIQ